MAKSLVAFAACCGLLAGAAMPLSTAFAADYGAPPNDAYRGGAVEDGYPEPVPPPLGGYDGSPPRGSYKDDAPPPVRRTAQCLSKPGLRAALNDQGWFAFDNVDYRGDVAFMTADNPRGRRFSVEFDACTGEVYKARPVEVYVERAPPPPIYYGRYYYGPPRPYVGFYERRHGYGHGYGHRHHHWR